MEILIFLPIIVALIVLLWMGWIDLKLWILPNELVSVFALMAIPFHIGIYAVYGDWVYGGWLYFFLGGLFGWSSLWIIRTVGSKIFKVEAMGMGDVKLFAAAGLWFGPFNTMIALMVGSFCGLFHGLVIALKKKSFRRLMLPAGPGFITGIILTFIWTYKDLFRGYLH